MLTRFCHCGPSAFGVPWAVLARPPTGVVGRGACTGSAVRCGCFVAVLGWGFCCRGRSRFSVWVWCVWSVGVACGLCCGSGWWSLLLGIDLGGLVEED